MDPSELYREETGEGEPILLIHPSGATGSTWGSVVDDLARIGHVITYDRRGYARSGGEPARSVATHTADAVALLDSLRTGPAVVVGVSAGAIIAVDLAVHRPDLVRAVIEHEGPWRFTRHFPTASQAATFARMGSFVVRGRAGDAAEALLRSAYAYRDGGTAWDAFPEEWRQAGRDNGTATLWDFVTTIGNHPSAAALATITAPVVCSYGSRSPDFIARCTRSFAAAIPGARVHRIEGSAHAAPFDAPAGFVRTIADVLVAAS
jgi:pimeloyl-ACP methyl ester carboxylesterase